MSTVSNSPTETADAPVLFSQDGPVGRILLNRPKALNALDLVMVDMMMAQLKSWEQDPSVKVVIIEGMGRRHSAPVVISAAFMMPARLMTKRCLMRFIVGNIT